MLLPGLEVAELTANVMAEASAAIGPAAVERIHALGPVFSGFSVRAASDEGAQGLRTFLAASPGVKAYHRCVSAALHTTDVCVPLCI